MHFLSQYSSFLRRYLMVTPSVRIRFGLSHSRPGEREERCSVRNVAGFLVDVLLIGDISRNGTPRTLRRGQIK
jgi:hypothetical protein